MSQEHEHDWQEASPGYWECPCGAVKLISAHQEAKDG